MNCIFTLRRLCSVPASALLCSVVRPVSLFYHLFLINPEKRKAVQLCPLVNSGILHRALVPALRADGMGIDYTHPDIQAFDTVKVLDKKLKIMGRPPVVDPFA